MKILFIIPYPLKQAPSQRFRFEQYFHLLEEANHHYDTQSFLDSNNWQLFYKSGNTFSKAMALTKGFLKRFVVLLKVFRYDFIFIHREASPVGPPVFEWLIAKLLKRKIIYDFDDAIWLTDQKDESFFRRIAKWRCKVRRICEWSHKISCGNHYLQKFALAVNPHAYFNPTTIDTRYHRTDRHRAFGSNSITLGWTGSHSTLKYLQEIEPTLQKIEDEYPFIRICIIADQKPSLQLRTMEFIRWNKKTEVKDLAQLDIGLMPLPDDEWAKGKCGFKIIQYLSLGIPSIASPVGVNVDLIQNGVTGFLCNTPDAWHKAIKTLIEDEKLRKEFGDRGKEFIQRTYSTDSNSANFLRLFEES
jgi:glycosyltransferase involved in cell wall biosynthesis